MSYEVGYGKPPKKSQFQKGQSGNPSGRPKAVASNDGLTDDTVKDVSRALRRKVRFTDRGVVKKMTVLEASISKQVHKAVVDGDPKAFGYVLKLMEKLELAVREGRTATPLRIIVQGGLPDN